MNYDTAVFLKIFQKNVTGFRKAGSLLQNLSIEKMEHRCTLTRGKTSPQLAERRFEELLRDRRKILFLMFRRIQAN